MTAHELRAVELRSRLSWLVFGCVYAVTFASLAMLAYHAGAMVVGAVEAALNIG